jgi:hypothetical protein
MEQDSHKDIWDMMTTRKRMLMRHIQRSDGHLIEIERRMKEITVPVERRKSGGTVWAWAKKVLSFASSEANKIRIDE